MEQATASLENTITDTEAQQTNILGASTPASVNQVVATKAQQGWLLFAISLMALMINVDYTAVNLSLVTIASYLQTNLDTIQWALSGYMLAWAAIVIPAGNKIDVFGQKKMCLIGISLFLFGSILAGLSSQSWLFITARVIQGISGAIYVPTLYALIFKNFPRERLGFAMGLVGVGIGFGMAIGPTLGGVILDSLGWRWIFFINIPIAVIAFLIIAQFAKPDDVQESTQKTDNIGATILGLCVILLMFSLSQMNVWGLISYRFLSTIIISVLLFLLFAVWQTYTKNKPSIPFALFRNRNYVAVIVAFFFEQYAFSASMVLIALFFQKVLGIGVMKASLMFLTLNLLFGAVAPFGGAIVDKIGVRRPALIGSFILAFGLLWFSQLTASSSFTYIYLCLAIIGLGMGFAFSAFNSGIVKTIDANDAGIASGVFLLLALLGNVCGVVISTYIYQMTAVHALIKSLQQTLQLSLSQSVQLNNMVHYVGGHTHDLSNFSLWQQHQLIASIPHSLNAGISAALLVAALGMLFATLVVFFCINKEA